MIKKIVALGIAAYISTAAGTTIDMNKLYKDAEIMRNILVTSLKQNNERGGIRFHSVDSTYLQGQGLLFEVKTNSGGWNFNFNFAEIMGQNFVVPTPPEPSELPNVFISTDGENSTHFQIDIEDDFLEIAEQAREIAREALRETRDKFRELRQNERELSWEAREIERRLRDIEFEMRHADEQRMRHLKDQQKELQKEQAELEEKRAEIARYAEELEAKEKAAREKQHAEEAARIKRFLAAFEATVAETLCSYGGGLRDLPSDEKVNFVLTDFGERTTTRGRDKMDKVYVFSNKDIKNCVADKIDENKLIERAETYMF
ncbi:MAG: hypothetical protein ACFHVJ_00340 [Aestuariibacter sp.]